MRIPNYGNIVITLNCVPPCVPRDNFAIESSVGRHYRNREFECQLVVIDIQFPIKAIPTEILSEIQRLDAIAG